MDVELIIEELVNLRKKIGANLVGFEPEFERNNARAKMIEALENGGIELEDLSELKIADDDTFIYHGRRVILHIRDITMHPDRFNLPKYHLVNCDTYKKMRAIGRKERYVVASRDNGLFNIKRIAYNKLYESEEKLQLCKNCLRMIGKDILGNNEDMYIKRFFDRYPKDYEFGSGHKSDKTSKINTYTQDWSTISSQKRAQAKYICQKCYGDYSNDKNLLHVHHKNGQKNDNRDENLIVLCRRCHSMEPMHDHMRI
ncbi:HNH endonuclease [Campylobacter fetus]|uniref:HNH nuclease domain-containing protein n=1 Tax=Campylobacter fetus subsp. testudinum TaxID=1507806 RepID=A0AAX0HBI0_CAMFE|nr:HNH endonuclease signature motif containing protein [Campylobacter fetus]EAK0827020.1 HNH endonuclease [Campylobacter fetus]EAK0830719.1 HNH endonuclease [Campylobacter fetus]OCR90641.1 hypothetical protein CFT12S02225_06320 [Campylobacter fetus subsp. testudinum]OCR92469.1 hypothetical protein CFT12S02263_05525 [Campylobacter fetus subsp. testudinum]